MKKALTVLTGIIIALALFAGGVYASQWLNFTGDEQLEQSENNVDEIMEILRNVHDGKMSAEQAVGELQQRVDELEDMNPSGLAKQNKELKQQNEQLKNEKASLVTQLEQKQREIQEKIDEGNRKVAEKQKELDQVAQERDGHKQRADELQRQINENADYVAHLEAELTRANEAVNEHSNKTQKAVEEARTYGGNE